MVLVCKNYLWIEFEIYIYTQIHCQVPAQIMDSSWGKN